MVSTMKYEVVTLEEKVIVGVSVETSNEDLQMKEKIGALWTQLYQTGMNATIKNKVNERAIGLYSDYSQNGYVASAGVEVSKADNTELSTKVIPAGKYAKFSIEGPMEKVVGEAWGEIWSMPLDRSFTGDFEEYLNDDFKHSKIDIYIALN